MDDAAVFKLNRTISKAIIGFKPPDDITVAQWAERNRRLPSETSAEPGRWKNTRTPYLVEPMNAFTDSKVTHITIMSASQVGKSEVLLNILGYIIDNDPAPVMYIMPTIDDVKDFSVGRIAPMIRETPALRDKVSDAKSRDTANSMLRKAFPGGILYMAGTNSASSLASKPVRYILGDERDRWSTSAGTEGDPFELVKARTRTFNPVIVEVSTPVIKGTSKIAKSYELGTQETWQHECPECGEYHKITFNDIKFEYNKIELGSEIDYEITETHYVCPTCGCLIDELILKRQPAKWVANNPDAYERGERSFCLDGFSSPWMTWAEIARAFLLARKDPLRLQIVYNTMFGELWEPYGDLEDEDTIMSRREEYNAELPDGVLVLTCGVDTQDDRLEYEIVGHGHYGETWGIVRGVILGEPRRDSDVWEELDRVIDRTYRFKNGKGLIVAITFIDSGGHYTPEVYWNTAKRLDKRVFSIKGRDADGIPYTSPKPSQVDITFGGRKTGVK
ncbi:MAG: phage terminase large subunit family protein, partial [Clostridiales Family XIII bacterium]|nr:phage terminase large subunit family protein [Clostridiales Family XIII bacterium]